MSKADHAPTTGGREGVLIIPAASLPSIYELGRHLAQVDSARHKADLANLAAKNDPEGRRHDEAMNLLMSRGEALRDVIATMKPVTLQDAAVQLDIAIGYADDLYGNENTEVVAKRLALGLLRIVLGVMPIVGAAAGLDAAEMGWSDTIGLLEHRFAGLEYLA